ncbi:MAG: bifunctional nicotinamidase/pyrazinamidase [Rhodobacteraceae bacterium]|nr:bifunctional nicotinamidase/pyrazinamidase [Paracoccaceae bacterium]
MQIRNNDTALIVIDVQNDFCPGGALAVPDGDGIVGTANALMNAASHPVLTQDWHPAGHSSFASAHKGKEPFSTIELSYGTQALWPDHCVQHTHGAEFHPGLDAAAARHTVRKGFRQEIDSYSAFFENDRRTATGLHDYLSSHGIKAVACIGLATDFCVFYSVMDALSLGYRTAICEEACRAIDLEGSLEAARTAMRGKGAVEVSAAELLSSSTA